LVYGNSSGGQGGGTYVSDLWNCTVVGNSAGFAGGSAHGTIRNSIIYYNSGDVANSYSTLFNCCTTPDPGGIGNITAAPAFIDLAGMNLRLQSNSPCINSGNNVFALTDLDLDGSPRIRGGTVDIGAYEYQAPASILSYAWAQKFGLPVDGSADFADSDEDQMNNWQEWRAGTEPTNPLSVLSLLSLSASSNSSGISLTWRSVAGIIYQVERSSSLAVQAFLPVQTSVVGTSNLTSVTDTTATNGGPYFYRVAVQQ
jgi:hypothetical protein